MHTPLDNKKLNLAELFAKFVAYSLSQSKAGAYDQPVYTGQEENTVNKHYEIQLQKINEGGVR